MQKQRSRYLDPTFIQTNSGDRQLEKGKSNGSPELPLEFHI